MDAALIAPKPAHVPDELVVDLDIYAIPGLEEDGTSPNIHATWKREVQDKMPPIFWTPRHGGHWVLTRYDEMREMALNARDFSNNESFLPRGKHPLLIPVMLDAPDHMKFRKIINPVFSPANLKIATERARDAAVRIIEALRPRGHCEFVGEFASVMPVTTFLSLINLPVEDSEYLFKLTKRMAPTHPEVVEAWQELERYVVRQIDKRRSNPQDDFLTSLLSTEVDGRAITEEEMLAMAKLVVGGGLDTVVLVTSFTACHLAQHPEHRRQLLENPQLRPKAVEEFLRSFGTSNLGRIAVADSSIGGIEMKSGDFVLALFPMAGLDETRNDDPLTVDFNRRKPDHLIFSTGPHTCVGNGLAKREIAIFLEEWLPRIPDFRLPEGYRPRMTAGMLNEIHELQLEWDPR